VVLEFAAQGAKVTHVGITSSVIKITVSYVMLGNAPMRKGFVALNQMHFVMIILQLKLMGKPNIAMVIRLAPTMAIAVVVCVVMGLAPTGPQAPNVFLQTSVLVIWCVMRVRARTMPLKIVVIRRKRAQNHKIATNIFRLKKTQNIAMVTLIANTILIVAAVCVQAVYVQTVVQIQYVLPIISVQQD